MLGRLDEDEQVAGKNVTVEKPASAKSSDRKRDRPEAVRATSKVSGGQSVSGNDAKESGRSVPLYMRLERKETRLRTDQYAKLTEHARRLSRAKTEGDERITENTLIRVAIDLLLDQAEALQGSNEAELRKSVTP